VTLAGAMFGGIYGLIRGNQDGWTSPGILAALASCVILLAAFGLVEHERRNRQPMLELALFRNPALAGACVGALMISASIFSVLLYLTLYLQDVLRYSAFQTGLRFLPLTIPIILAAPVAGRLSGRVPLRLLIGGGLALVAIGLALMTVISATSGWTVLLAGMIVSGLGSGFINPALASAAVGTVSREKAGVGSGINNTFRQVGIAVGICRAGGDLRQHRARQFRQRPGLAVTATCPARQPAGRLDYLGRRARQRPSERARRSGDRVRGPLLLRDRPGPHLVGSGHHRRRRRGRQRRPAADQGHFERTGGLGRTRGDHAPRGLNQQPWSRHRVAAGSHDGGWLDGARIDE
jgi:hypothetical protein